MQERLRKNAEGMTKLAQCRTLPDFGAVQSDLARDNLDQIIHLTRRIAEQSDVTDFLHLVLVGREPDFAGAKKLLDRFLVALFRGQHELLMRADDAVVERCAGDDLRG